MIVHKHVIFIITLIALHHCHSEREFPLKLWKNYELDSQVLVVSHSQSRHAVRFVDRVQAEWPGEYQFSGTKILMEFKKN